MIENSLWVERHRPTSLKEYVFANDSQRIKIEEWVAKQDVPHILFSGGPGTGKSSCAKVLVNELNIDPYDYLFINASRQRDVDTMRTKINSFVSAMPFGRMRIVQLDEADYMTPDSQATLRGIMEQFSATSRFLLTCNYPHKIIPAIHSRTQSMKIEKLDIDDYTARAAEILLAEKIEFNIEDLDDYVRGSWPDLRKCISNLQANSIKGKLQKAEANGGGERDYRIDAVALFKAGKFREARQLICSQLRAEELDDFFRFLYDNLDLWGDGSDAKKDEAILIIRKGLVQIPLAADAEILTAAVLTELMQIS